MIALRRVAHGVVVVGMAWCLAACGGSEGAGRAEVVAKIKSDPGMAGTPNAAVECVADWYMTYASEEQRAAFVRGQSGDRAPEQVAGSEEARTAILDCLKSATANSPAAN
ncbi:nucleoside/nucleotide kinase family protein [Streptoalloteichus hindustanus]|uniref:Uncharacterized protein n=1 Tax=Streptoalloteichus hindustanus TaxID=2017 RepID=A0A1M5MU94_STRHI|nr:hypothetical protein [Streptoalloteichus hindustanus]SHG80878.1 hypothetical protein SAMN05444320_11454 [Streptoalloteichus hindustanus]